MKNYEKLVTKILENNESARKDDYLLYLDVLEKQGLDTNMSVRYFFTNYKYLKAPNFKTIERNRRKICKTRKDLIDNKTAMARDDEEKAYIQYGIE